MMSWSGRRCCTLWGSPWTSGKRQQVTDQDDKQEMGARRSCQLDLFEFLLGTLQIYMLSLAIWMRI
jgi:hypothetical protein